MRAIKIVMLLSLMIAGSSRVNAGPVIIDGTDANQHGFATDGKNQGGWLYMQRVLEALARQVPPTTAKVVIVLGTSPGLKAREAIQSAFDRSSLPESGWNIYYKEGSNVIDEWLTSISVSNTGILYIPTYIETEGDLGPDEMATINKHASDIANYVEQAGIKDQGGALFAMAESGADADGNKAYTWVETLIPGLRVFDAGGEGIDTRIDLTKDGLQTGLPEGDIAIAIPWHDYFEFADGSHTPLAVLATAQDTAADPPAGKRRNIILGPALADLAITKTASPDLVKVGSQFIYAINVTNKGPNMATNIIFTDRLPPNLDFQSIIKPPDWSCIESSAGNSAVINCSAKTLQADETKNFQILTTVNCPDDQATTMINTATINSSAFESGQDNNRAEVTTALEGAARATIRPSAISFANVNARSITESKNPVSEIFVIENTGCAPLNLRFVSVIRGTDAGLLKKKKLNDSKFFTLNQESGSMVSEGSSIETILVGDKKTFHIQFDPIIPEVPEGKHKLPASKVLPDEFDSALTFAQEAGPDIKLKLTGHVMPSVKLIARNNPVRPAQVKLEKSGDQVTVTFFVFISNRDVKNVQYKFFNKDGSEVPILDGDEITDLTTFARQFVKGQSFGAIQHFANANDHPSLSKVKVIVCDSKGGCDSSEASLSAANVTVKSVKSLRSVTLSLPLKQLTPARNASRTNIKKEKRKRGVRQAARSRGEN